MSRSIVLAVLSLLAASPAFAADKVTLMLNWYVYGEHAPFFLGKQLGFYKKEGIDLRIEEGRGSAITTQAVAAGTADFGYVDIPTMIKAASMGAPVIAIGVALQTSPMAAMGFASKNIRTPADIKGKIVAVSPGDSMSQIWPLFLKKVGLRQSAVKTVSGNATTKLDAVINGRADLLLGYVMDQSMRIKDATGKSVYPIKFADYGINLVSSGVIARKAFLKKHPGLARRFLAATVMSIKAAVKSPAAAADAILKAMPKAGHRATLREGFKLTIPLYKAPGAKKLTPLRVSASTMDDSVKLLVKSGFMGAAAGKNPHAYYTNAYLPK